MIREYIRAALNEYKARGFESLPVRFIVSTGRTGTQFFESFFNHNFPEVLFLHQPPPDGFDLSINKVREKHPRGKIVKDLRISRLEVLLKIRERGARIYIESNPFLSLLVPELREAFPTARFLWIVRDPTTYVVSAYNKSPVGDNKMFFYAENDHRDRINALDFPNDRWREDWRKFDRFQKVCWFWNKCNEILEQEFSDHEDFLLTKFEDLFSPENNYHGIFKMLEFFQIKVPQGMDKSTLDILMRKNTNASERVLLKGVKTWTDEQRMHLDELTYSMRRKLGY
jgi:hypothetical protein